VDELVQKRSLTLPLINEKKRRKKGAKYKDSGTLHLLQIELRREYTFLDFVSAGYDWWRNGGVVFKKVTARFKFQDAAGVRRGCGLHFVERAHPLLQFPALHEPTLPEPIRDGHSIGISST